jgi:phospholipid/cholesterol/gamma-HCH transport system substrate-binding protein
MAALKTNFAVGLFMITGIAIATAAVIFVGASNYLRPGRLYATYYDESVQGLSKDSPVKYRGVSIGQVHDIRIAGSTDLVEVLLRIASDWEPGEDIIAQLKSIGITGIMYVELDVRQPHEQGLYPQADYKTDYPVIPTRSSDIAQLMSGLEELVQQLKRTDLQDITLKLLETVDTVNQSVKDARIREMADGLSTIINRANQLLADPRLQNILVSAENAGAHLDQFAQNADTVTNRINRLVAENETDLSAAVDQLRYTLTQAGRLMRNGDRTMNRVEESIARLEKNLTRTITQLESVSRSLNTLADRSASQPSLLFFGAPLPDKKVESYD